MIAKDSNSFFFIPSEKFIFINLPNNSLSSLGNVAGVVIPNQIHIAYTGIAGQLSVDFVSDSFNGSVHWGFTNTSLTSINTTSSFNYTTIGILHQGLMTFEGVTAGQKVYYQVKSDNETSAIFEVTPIISGVEKYAVFGDFGLKSDVSMYDLTSEAAAGSFDTVLHVGE